MSKMQGTVERDKFGKCKFADLSVLGYILYEGYNIYVFQTYDKFEKKCKKINNFIIEICQRNIYRFSNVKKHVQVGHLAWKNKNISDTNEATIKTSQRYIFMTRLKQLLLQKAI